MTLEHLKGYEMARLSLSPGEVVTVFPVMTSIVEAKMEDFEANPDVVAAEDVRFLLGEHIQHTQNRSLELNNTDAEEVARLVLNGFYNLVTGATTAPETEDYHPHVLQAA